MTEYIAFSVLARLRFNADLTLKNRRSFVRIDIEMMEK